MKKKKKCSGRNKNGNKQIFRSIYKKVQSANSSQVKMPPRWCWCDAMLYWWRNIVKSRWDHHLYTWQGCEEGIQVLLSCAYTSQFVPLMSVSHPKSSPIIKNQCQNLQTHGRKMCTFLNPCLFSLLIYRLIAESLHVFTRHATFILR